MNILVTAGPTREPLDPVRFISNRSSGRMGYAVAEAARAAGHQVTLVSGPVTLAAHRDIQVVRVTTAAEMGAAVVKSFASCEALVMVAAVADWRPVAASAHKLKKTGRPLVLRLEPTVDILGQLRSRKGDRIVVGFAAETERLVEEAARKLREKQLDLIVANDVRGTHTGFDVDDNEVTFIDSGGHVEHLPVMTKAAIAQRIVSWVEDRKVEKKTKRGCA